MVMREYKKKTDMNKTITVRLRIKPSVSFY